MKPLFVCLFFKAVSRSFGVVVVVARAHAIGLRSHCQTVAGSNAFRFPAQ